jgi:two-component system response regulator PilR (NtrC family)
VKQEPMILVAEDETVSRRNVGKVLQDEGYRVVLTQDGEQAVSQVLANPPDLLLTNLRMPKLSGFDVAARVRQVSPDMPILLMTGLTTPQLKRMGRRVGIRDIITKPFDFGDLLRRIAAALARRRQP